MPNTLQSFLTHATQKASDELSEAYLRLPEDKRNWSPESTARTALDQVAECAILNGYTAELIASHAWAADRFNNFMQEKADLCGQDWDTLHALLQENTRKVIAAIDGTPDDALQTEVELPWKKQPLAEILAYSYWNMTYHQGQISYIASLLGSLFDTKAAG